MPKDDHGSKMLKGLRKITANVQPGSEIFSDDNQRKKLWLNEHDKHHAAAHRTAPHDVEGELTSGLSAADRQRDSGASGVLSHVRFRLLNRIPKGSSGGSPRRTGVASDSYRSCPGHWKGVTLFFPGWHPTEIAAGIPAYAEQVTTLQCDCWLTIGSTNSTGVVVQRAYATPDHLAMRGRRAGQRPSEAEEVYGLTRRSLYHSCVNGPGGRDMYCVVHCLVGAVVATSSGALRRVVRCQSIREFRSYGLVRDSCQRNCIHWDRRLFRGGMVRLLQHALCNGDHRCPWYPLTGTKRTPHLQVCAFLNSAESVVSRGWLHELSPSELYQCAESLARD